MFGSALRRPVYDRYNDICFMRLVGVSNPFKRVSNLIPTHTGYGLLSCNF